MKPADLSTLIDLPWMVFLVYWIVAAVRTRETQKRESSASRYLVAIILVCGYVLLFSRRVRIGFLGTRFAPDTPLFVILGIVLTWAGVALAIWARYHLAENWSAVVTIKVGHQLIRSGPYSHLRHPIYSGLLLATLGTALAVGKWQGLLGFCLVTVACSMKARKEEAMLAEQFGSAFEEHRRHTGFLLPRFR